MNTAVAILLAAGVALVLYAFYGLLLKQEDGTEEETKEDGDNQDGGWSQLSRRFVPGKSRTAGVKSAYQFRSRYRAIKDGRVHPRGTIFHSRIRLLANKRDEIPDYPEKSIGASQFGIFQISKLGGKVVDLNHPHIAYKATENGILQLIIPSGATVVSPKSSRKFRTDRAIPVGWFSSRGIEKTMSMDQSIHSRGFRYHAGQIVAPDKLDTSTNRECSNGIHFFSTYSEAKNWHMRYR